MKILITGGAGFIGSNFVRKALNRGDEVLVLDLLTYAGHPATLRELSNHLAYTFIQGDINDRVLVRTIFRTFKPQAVAHFAAETHVDRSIDDPAGFVRTNVLGTFELLEAARNHYEDLPEAERKAFRFLHVSTDEVYGSLGPTGFFEEDTPYAPNSPYSASKAGADHLARAYFATYGLPVLITNCSNNYGPYQFPEKLVPLMVLNALEGRELPIYGDGGQVRDWLHVEDHCEAIFAVLEKGRPGEKYLVGARNEKNNLQMVDAILGALEVLRPAQSNSALIAAGVKRYEGLKKFVKDRPGHDRRYGIDPSKTEKETGWKPSHSFEAGLKATVEWYLAHLDWCREVQSGNYDRGRLGLGVGGKA